jgi:hypothetical protein
VGEDPGEKMVVVVVVVVVVVLVVVVGEGVGGLRTLLHLEPVLQLGHALGHLLCAG